MKTRFICGSLLALVTGVASAAQWEIEITNVTPGQTFTPILVATHYGDSGVPAVGTTATDGLAMLAEGGATGPLGAEIAAATGSGTQLSTLDGLLGPGQTVATVVSGLPGQRLTLAAMLIPTNDTFFAVGNVFLPLHGNRVVQALAYDAGSEANSQQCADIPGPRCGGAGYSPGANDGDEGFVHVGNGFHELGAGGDGPAEVLSPVHYDWNNPVAIVTIRRIYGAP